MIQITLNPRLTKHERIAIGRYLTRHGRLRAEEWVTALHAFDSLGASTLTVEGKTETFSAIYTRLVEEQHADRFIERLLALETDVQAEGERLKAAVARTIAQDLNEAGFYRRDVPETRYLLAYCYYWWDAFARGYIFEARIYQDLAQSDIEFLAHDIRDPVERRSRSDLIILGREGDVKTSTYFLTADRTKFLRHDFYIARLYDARQHRYTVVVLMTEEAWRDIDGDITPTALDEAADLLPEPVQVEYAGSPLIVVDYDVWKQRVKTRQRQEEDDERDAD
jgi:hypothetical protein